MILVSPSLLHAQASSNTPVDLGVWLGYQGNHAMEKDSLWRLVIAGVAKRNKEIVDAQAYLLKGGIGYELKRDLQVSAGYIIERHIPFDSSSQPYKWTEHRIFEEVQFSISPGSGNKTLKQRVSLEERWLARKSAPDYERVTSYKFETTLKYQLQFVFPLNPKTDSIFYDEVHLRLLPRNEKRLDQNRLFAGLSFKIESKNISRLEVGYMLQTAHNSAETAEGLQRVNHVISVTVISDAPLKVQISSNPSWQGRRKTERPFALVIRILCGPSAGQFSLNEAEEDALRNLRLLSRSSSRLRFLNYV